MCPDLHTLSAYLDGELAVRWAKEIEKHLAECTTCKSQLKRLTDVKEALSRVTEPDSRRSRERVWTRLCLHQEEIMYHFHGPLLRRRLNVPLPLAAAAAVMILVMGFTLVFLLARSNMGTMKITKEPSGVTEVLLNTSFKELQQILGSLDQQSFQFQGGIVIPLPDDKPFVMTGEPILTRDGAVSRR